MDMEIYDARTDEQFSKGYIDIDEMRTRRLDDGKELPFRYIDRVRVVVQ